MHVSMVLTVRGVITANVCQIEFSILFHVLSVLGDLHFGDVKLAEIPAWIARRDKTPMGVYQGGIRSKSTTFFLIPNQILSFFHQAFWKFYRAYLDNKKPNLIWYTQIFVVASLINFVFFAIPDRSESISLIQSL